MAEKLISKKKPFYPISTELNGFLQSYDRWIDTPIFYEDLLRFSGSVAVYDKHDNDTLWVRVYYTDSERREIDYNLKKIYTLLHSDGNESGIQYLNVDAIDYCTFGNSKPFRIKIRNVLNDNFTYYYLKKTDASRVYGLELEHMLSPYNLNFLVNQSTLIEEHIAGIPGDHFIKEFLPHCTDAEKAQIAKEYVKFNERSMIRLLGDMRAYNYVVEMTPDFEHNQYRVRAIDFDQQCYEGRKSFYLPQFFKNNLPVVNLCSRLINLETSHQYQREERTLIKRRFNVAPTRITRLRECMCVDTISSDDKLLTLRNELSRLHQDTRFDQCTTMGEITFLNIAVSLGLQNEVPDKFS